MTRILLAFDKFKDALGAPAAGAAVAAALLQQRPDWVLDLAPLADGGEGFASILTSAAGGRMVMREVAGPRGDRTMAMLGLVRLAAIPSAARDQLQLSGSFAPDAEIAIVEMAAASGLGLLAEDRRDPWRTTTFGTGELMNTAAQTGAVALLLGVGGSATNDLGLGALAALGLDFLDTRGEAVHPPVPAAWPRIAHIVGAPPAGFPPVYIACDVTNPLLGPRGAAAVYGPQKGLLPEDCTRLEGESARLASLLCSYAKRPEDLRDAAGTGAAGGLAFGLMVGAGAKVLPGFELVSAWLNLEWRIAAADIVITGEGRFDDSSLEGKGPGAIAACALALGKEVHVFAGQVTAAPRPGLALHAITPAGRPLAQALRETADNLAIATRAAFPCLGYP